MKVITMGKSIRHQWITIFLPVTAAMFRGLDGADDMDSGRETEESEQCL